MRILLPCLLVALVAGLAHASDSVNDPVDGAPAGPADGPPVTRSEAVLTADRFARVHWTMSEINRTGASCGGGFQSPYPAGERIGMAYKWGGWDTVEEFLRKIGEGYGAGTGGGADTYDRFPRECVTGTSCAGLVSRAWKLEHKYTLDYASPRIRRKLGEITHAVTGVDLARGIAGDLRKGDALISATHVMFFVYETRDHRVMVIDARPPGTTFRSTTWSWLAGRDYRAIRYNNIVEGPEPAGTRARPIPISVAADRGAGRGAGPGAGRGARPAEGQGANGQWVSEGNTRDVVSMEFDRYAAAPQIDQQGPEVVYALTLPAPAMVVLRITDVPDEGIDNDLHLLASLRADEMGTAVDCLGRGDREIRCALEAGDLLRRRRQRRGPARGVYAAGRGRVSPPPGPRRARTDENLHRSKRLHPLKIIFLPGAKRLDRKRRNADADAESWRESHHATSWQDSSKPE